MEAARARGLRGGFVYVAPDGAALANLARLMADGHLRIAVEDVLPPMVGTMVPVS